MLILHLAGLAWPIFFINCQSVDYDAAAFGDEMSPAYYRRTAGRMPVIVLGEPIRVMGGEQREDLGPGFVFGDEQGGTDFEVEDGERDGEGEYYGGDEEGEYDEGEQQSSLPLPPPGINIRQV